MVPGGWNIDAKTSKPVKEIISVFITDVSAMFVSRKTSSMLYNRIC